MSEHTAKVEETLELLRPYNGIYQRQAIEDAIALKEEITPHLISILEDTLARPEWYVEQDVMSHIYAFILLGYFEEAGAHRVIVDLFSLPEELIDPLFGDLITEDLHLMLFRTCHGEVDEIKRLITNKNAYEYCRGGAVEALGYAAVEGLVSREETLDFLGSLFTGTEDDDPNSIFWSLVAASIRDLYPEELMPVINRAFEEGLIDTSFIGPESFTKALKAGKAATLEEFRKTLKTRLPEDIHAYMSWWAMFKNEDKPALRNPFLSPLTQFPVQASELPKANTDSKKKKKKKRKLAKASKKKNRR